MYCKMVHVLFEIIHAFDRIISLPLSSLQLGKAKSHYGQVPFPFQLRLIKKRLSLRHQSAEKTRVFFAKRKRRHMSLTKETIRSASAR